MNVSVDLIKLIAIAKQNHMTLNELLVLMTFHRKEESLFIGEFLGFVQSHTGLKIKYNTGCAMLRKLFKEGYLNKHRDGRSVKYTLSEAGKDRLFLTDEAIAIYNNGKFLPASLMMCQGLGAKH